MTPNTSAYERITELVSLLSDYDFEPTVRRISLKTESSLPQTREDLAQLHKLGIRLYPPDVAESLTRTESRYDDVVLELDSDLPVRHSLLFLNKMEQSLLKDNNSGRLLIKDSSLPVSDSVRRHIDRIEEAVRKRCYVRFMYRSPVIGHNEYIEIAPLRLFLNTTDGLFYCISINEDEKMLTYRLDRILFDVHLVKKQPEILVPVFRLIDQKLKRIACHLLVHKQIRSKAQRNQKESCIGCRPDSFLHRTTYQLQCKRYQQRNSERSCEGGPCRNQAGCQPFFFSGQIQTAHTAKQEQTFTHRRNKGSGTRSSRSRRDGQRRCPWLHRD